MLLGVEAFRIDEVMHSLALKDPSSNVKRYHCMKKAPAPCIHKMHTFKLRVYLLFAEHVCYLLEYSFNPFTLWQLTNCVVQTTQTFWES